MILIACVPLDTLCPLTASHVHRSPEAGSIFFHCITIVVGSSIEYRKPRVAANDVILSQVILAISVSILNFSKIPELEALLINNVDV